MFCCISHLIYRGVDHDAEKPFHPLCGKSFGDPMTLVPQKNFSDLLSFMHSERHLICRGEISDTFGPRT